MLGSLVHARGEGEISQASFRRHAAPAPLLVLGGEDGATPRFATQLVAPWDAQVDDGFGTALALDGDRLLVGIPHDAVGIFTYIITAGVVGLVIWAGLKTRGTEQEE